MIRLLRSSIVASLAWGLATASAQAQPTADEAALLDFMDTRERILSDQAASARATAQKQALLAYRLVRQRDRGYLGAPENRRAAAQAATLALMALGRSAGEARALGQELDRVHVDRHGLATALRWRGEGSPAAPDVAPLRFLRPVKGALVGEPGTRRDSETGTRLRLSAIELLARLNEPVRAGAAGVVRHIEALPQGGYAVVTAHPGGWVSILSGLRDVSVAAGDSLALAQPVGFAGRNLDGAAVITMEIWRHRQPVDPRQVVTGLEPRQP